jgi:hypothetical protein
LTLGCFAPLEYDVDGFAARQALLFPFPMVCALPARRQGVRKHTLPVEEITLDLRLHPFWVPECTPFEAVKADIASPNTTVSVLVGLSGCGKTRVIVELTRSYFVVFFDCAQGDGSYAGGDLGYAQLCEQVRKVVDDDKIGKNHGREKAVSLCRATVLSRLLFLARRLEADAQYATRQFLLDQQNGGQDLMCQWALAICSMSDEEHGRVVEFVKTALETKPLLFAIDDAHIARATFGHLFVSTSQLLKGGNVCNEKISEVIAEHRRGLLGCLISACFEVGRSLLATKSHIVVAGISKELVHSADVQASHDGKPLGTNLHSQFRPWSRDNTKDFMNSVFSLPQTETWPDDLLDATRPRWIEMLIKELYEPGGHCSTEPQKESRRVASRLEPQQRLTSVLNHVRDKVSEMTIGPAIRELLKEDHKALLIRLTACSQCTLKSRRIAVRSDGVDLAQRSLCYLATDDQGGNTYFVGEDWVQAELETVFAEDLKSSGFTEALAHLHNIISQHGPKTQGKGVAFETVALLSACTVAEGSVGTFLSKFGLKTSEVPQEILGTVWSFSRVEMADGDSDIGLIENRNNTSDIIKPQDLMRPDGIGFLTDTFMLLVGIKLYSKNVSYETVYLDNFQSTDPERLFLAFGGQATDTNARNRAVAALSGKPVTWTLRLSIVLPNIATPRAGFPPGAEPRSFIDVHRQHIHVLWTKDHLGLFSEDVRNVLAQCGIL